MSEVCIYMRDPQIKQRLVKISDAVGSANEGNVRALKTASGDLAAGDSGTVCFAWQNPEATEIIVYNVIINVVTIATAAAEIDVGPAADATAGSIDDSIFADLVVGTAVKCETSYDAVAAWVGTAPPPTFVNIAGGATAWITGVENGTQNMAGLVGRYYIFYMTI